MNVALVHDYLNQRGGAERVFAHIAAAWPEAPVYTALYDANSCGDLVAASRVRTSFLQHVPLGRRFFRALAPLYPAAFEAFDFSGYDLIVSSTTAWAKGVIFPPSAVHVCYINTPSRFLFEYDRYVGGLGAGTIAKPVIGMLAAWDRRAAMRPTAFIANSQNVAQRVRAHYGRDAFVLPCPVDVDRFSLAGGDGEYFLIVSRLLPYKRVELAIEAARIAGVRLLVAGEGPMLETLQRLARGTPADVLGWVSDDKIASLLAGAKAVIVPGEEDFGLVPLEAAACGRPAIALRRGGALETIVEGVTGEFFERPDAESLAAALRAFDRNRYQPERLRAHAQQFAPHRFAERLRGLIGEIVQYGEDGARRRVASGAIPASGA
ncbi:MAG: glycosyltransferase [Vulcanimicrobiaceae bacterium]